MLGRVNGFVAPFALVAALAAAAPAAAAEPSLPQVASGQRPGPEILYSDPPRAPQLESVAPWEAAPILVSGASAYRTGEFLYQDFLYDDRGARGADDPTDPFDRGEFGFSPKSGTLTYPTDPVFANNAADLVELRVKPLADETAFRVTLNTLKDPARTAFTIAIGSSADARDWPRGAGVKSPAAFFLTVHGDQAELVDAAGGAARTPAPRASVDLVRRQIEVRVPHAAWDPGRGTVRMAAGVGLWNAGAGSYLTPGPVASATATAPGGAAPSRAALFNLAFRFKEPTPAVQSAVVNTFVEGAVLAGVDRTWWRERAQSEALADGDISAFFADVDFAKLTDRATDETGVPATGPLDRIYPSRLVFGQGVDYGNDCGGLQGSKDQCVPRFVGQLQTYGLYVPRKPRPERGYGMTLLMHGLSGNHNEFLASRNESQFGERGSGSLVAAPYGRGPDGFYKDVAEADVFEVWADVARRYAIDPEWAAVSGYSMGGIGTYRLLERFPDLFGRGAPIVGFAQDSAEQLASLRNTPLIAWNGGQDELVNPALYEPTLMRLGELGLEFVSEVFEPAGHITLASNDEFGPMAEFLGEHRANRSPAHVTYVVAPGKDSSRSKVVADHAYWLSGLRLRDPKAGPTGTIDARSQAFGAGDAPALGVQPGAGVLTGGARSALPFVRRSQGRGPAPAQPARNEIDVTFANVGDATATGERARLDGSQPLTVKIGSDGAGRLRLDVPLPAGATVERVEGTAVASARAAGAARARAAVAVAAPEAALDRQGATFTVAAGSRTYRIAPAKIAAAEDDTPSSDSSPAQEGTTTPPADSGDGDEATDREQGASAAESDGGGSLPFTGFAAGLVGALGLGLAAAGGVLRRRMRA